MFARFGPNHHTDNMFAWLLCWALLMFWHDEDFSAFNADDWCFCSFLFLAFMLPCSFIASHIFTQTSSARHFHASSSDNRRARSPPQQCPDIENSLSTSNIRVLRALKVVLRTLNDSFTGNKSNEPRNRRQGADKGQR